MAIILSIAVENAELEVDEETGRSVLELETIDKDGQRHQLSFEGPALELLVKIVPAMAHKVSPLRRH